MTRLIQSYLFFFCSLSTLHLCAQVNGELPSGEKAEYFIDLSFKTDQSDSVMQMLDSALYYAELENNKDVFAETLIEKGEEYVRLKNGDSSSFYFEKGLRYSQKHLVSVPIRAKVFKRYGNHLGRQNQYFVALSYLDSAALLYLSYEDTLSYADAITLKGTVHDNNGNQGKALSSYLEASKIYEHYQDSALYAGIINNVAIVHKKLGDIERALEFYNRSADIHRALKDTMGLAIAQVNRGMLYKDLGQLEKAKTNVRASLSVFEEVKMSYGIAIAHHNLSEIHLLQDNVDSVLFHVDESQKIAINLEYWMIVVSNQIVLSKALRKMGRPDISNKSALRAYELASTNGFMDKLEELTSLLATNYETMDDHRSALRYYKEYKELQDGQLSKESQEQINRLRTEYDVQQKEEDIKDLELINTYQMNLAEKEKKLKHVLEAGIVLAFLVIVLFFYLYRRQRNFAKRLTAQKTQLTALNKEKDDLIAMVAHDLRSPLNNIKGLLGIIKDVSQDERDKMIALANQSTDVLRNRINQILDVEAINEGKINLKIEQVSVSEILTQLTRHISPEADKKQISFYTHSVKDMTCWADENYLLQVLENLCTNAIKFSKPGLEIFVRVTTEGNKITFEVQDQGQGIPKSEIKQLFTRHARISIRPTHNESSTGLGLPIVKKYVEAMGGNVWCESEVDKGSTFYVLLNAGDQSTPHQ
ncbi:MAG: tetratricopeptide repeat-containing sensor histidine kinase [Reichenbachiella sp.]|uniref:ATP-binding protein n=1 Tax=Reichenbachiella sp. TaxID=2184521 RepID=UPI00326645DD